MPRNREGTHAGVRRPPDVEEGGSSPLNSSPMRASPINSSPNDSSPLDGTPTDGLSAGSPIYSSRFPDAEKSAGMVFLQNKGYYHLVPAEGNMNTDLRSEFMGSTVNGSPADGDADGAPDAGGTAAERTLKVEQAKLFESRRKQNVYLGLLCSFTMAAIWAHSAIARQWIVDDFEMQNAFLVSGLEKLVCPFAFGSHYWFAERGKHNRDVPKNVVWHAMRSAPYILGMQYALIEGLGMTSATSAMVIGATSSATTYATALICGTAVNSWRIWLSTLLCFGAAGLIGISDVYVTKDPDGMDVEGGSHFKGDAFVFASTIFYALWVVDQEKAQLLYQNSPSLFWCIVDICQIGLSVVGFVGWHSITGDEHTFAHDFSRVPGEAQTSLYLSLMWIGLVDNTCCDYLWIKAIQLTDSAILVTICLALSMPISMLADCFYQGRSITWLQVVASIIVVLAIIFTVQRAEESKRYDVLDEPDDGESGGISFPPGPVNSAGSPVSVGHRLGGDDSDDDGIERAEATTLVRNRSNNTNNNTDNIQNNMNQSSPQLSPYSPRGSTNNTVRSRVTSRTSVAPTIGASSRGNSSKETAISGTRGLTQAEMRLLKTEPDAIHPNYYSIPFAFKSLREDLTLLSIFIFILCGFGFFFMLLSWRNTIVDDLPHMRMQPSYAYQDGEVSAEWKTTVDSLKTVGTTKISNDVRKWMKLIEPKHFFEQDKKPGNSNPEATALALELLKDKLCDGKRKQMLDAGSGSGYFTVLLEAAADSCSFRPRTITLGIDKDAQRGEQSKKNVENSGNKDLKKLVKEKHVRFIDGDVTKEDTYRKDAVTSALPYSKEPKKQFEVIHVGFVATKEEKAFLTTLLDVDEGGLMFLVEGSAGESEGNVLLVRPDGSQKFRS